MSTCGPCGRTVGNTDGFLCSKFVHTCARHFCSEECGTDGHRRCRDHKFTKVSCQDFPDEKQLQVTIAEKLYVSKKSMKFRNNLQTAAVQGTIGCTSGLAQGALVELGGLVQTVDTIIVADLLGVELTEQMVQNSVLQGAVGQIGNCAVVGGVFQTIICAGECSFYLCQYSIGRINEIQLREYSKSAALRATGGFVGGWVGGAVGTVLLPGVGTWIGATLGGIVGGLALKPGISRDEETQMAWEKIQAETKELKDAASALFPTLKRSPQEMNTLTKEQVTKQYRALARVYHPDMATGSEEAFQDLWKNYLTLMIFVEGKEKAERVMNHDESDV